MSSDGSSGAGAGNRLLASLSPALFDGIDAGVMVLDREHRIVLANRYVQRWVGLDAAELLGRRCHELLHRRPDPCDDCPVAITFRTGEPARTTHTGLDARGQVTCAAISSHPIRDEHGAVTHVFEYSRDIAPAMRAAELMRESEERFRNIYAASPIGIEIYDRQGQLVDANPACLRLFGVTRVEDIQGFRLFEDSHVSDEAKERLRRGETTRFEASFDFDRVKALGLYPTSRAGILELDVLITPLGAGDPAGVSGYLVQVQDITERRLAQDELERRVAERTEELRAEMAERERAQERYKNLVELSPDVIYQANTRGVTTYMNDAGHKLLEYGEELLGMPPEKLIHPDDVARAAESMMSQITSNGDVTNFECRYVTRTGRVIDALHSVRLLHDRDGVLIGFQGMARDITARKVTERLREEYVSLISHDLRQPLSALTTTAQSLQRMLIRLGLAEPRRRAEVVVANAQRMEAMIRELVETVYLESGELKLTRRPVDLLGLVRGVAERGIGADDRSAIHVRAGEPLPSLELDAARLERLIANLLDNARKYSPPDAPVEVLVTRIGDEAIVTVRDHGIGISAEELPHVFDRYHRSGRGKHRVEGLGLGLYIARLIVEAHGGRVSVDSEVDRGSTFRVALPI